jgi:magnesium transporter
MIEIFQKSGDEINKIHNFQQGCWINITAPATSEIEDICHQLKIPPNHISDPLDVDERARIDVEDNYMLILIRVPYYDASEEVSYRTLPLGIIYSPDYVITVASRRIELITDFFQGKVKHFDCANKERFILMILYRAALMYLNFLKEINARSALIEKRLHMAINNKELLNLLLLEKSLVYFTTSLKADEIMISRLSTTKRFKSSEDEEELFADVIIEYRQALEMSNIYSNILTGMMNAFASVISNNLNAVMRTLTSITILLMIPNLFAGFYGMNVKLPFQDSPYAYMITLSISFIFAIIAVMLLLRRRKG